MRRLRGNRDDLTALHWSNLLVVEPAICDCDGFAPFRFTGYNKMPRMGAFYYTWRRRRDYFAALHHLAKFARTRKPAYARPPFCGGSNPLPRVRIHIIKHNKETRPLGVFFYCGGDEGIRTLDTVARIHDFESRAFDHSATSPTMCDYTDSVFICK